MALTALQVKNAKPGIHMDGQGLFLDVKESGSKSWKLRYTFGSSRRAIGLGSLAVVGLDEARIAAGEARKLVHLGVDPIEHRDSLKEAEAAPKQVAKTFEQVATEYIELNRSGWRNAKHAAQWSATLETYTYKTIGKKSCAEITLDDVLKILKPIWSKKTETASRVRGRIEAVLGYATVHGLRDGVNPAGWRGNLEHVLPPAAKVAKSEHYAAMPYGDVKKFIKTIKAVDSTAARTLEFVILTACRSGEALGCQWSEFDLENKVWTVPGSRMKAGREHRVALSDAAVALVESMRGQDKLYVFPGRYAKTAQSSMTLTMMMRRMSAGLTVHGFRSSFRDWSAEVSDHASDAAELQLAHSVGSKVEQAYRRGNMFEKRLALMADWAKYVGANS